MFEINSIFPTSVIMGDLHREISKEELAVVEYHKTRVSTNIGNTTSLDKYILKTELPEIKTFIELGIKSYVDNILIPKHPLNFYITQSWLNYTSKGQFHHKHNHPNSILSGVFYFSADASRDKIILYNEKYKQITIPTKQYNLYNSETWWFTVKTGSLVIFPSYLTHMVEQIVSDDTRVSLAFNVFANGYFGDEDSLTALHL